MGHEFTLVLSREITDDESRVLQEAGCAGATISTAALPTNADVVVTQLDFDAEGPSLADAINSALEAVKTVPDLSAASLTAQPQPQGTATETEATPAEAEAEAADEATPAEAETAEAAATVNEASEVS